MAHDRIEFGFFFWDFVAIRGVPQIPQRVLKGMKMPGVDGMAFKFMSLEGSPSRVVLEAPALNLADEIDWIASMAELSGRQISLYSATSVGYHNQVFHEVTHEGTQACVVGAWGPYNLGSTGRLLTFSATVQYPYGS